MIMLRITGCSDAQRWYAGMEGAHVPCVGYSSRDGWKSLESSGFVNFVRDQDAIPVELLPTGDRELTVNEVLALLRSFRHA